MIFYLIGLGLCLLEFNLSGIDILAPAAGYLLMLPFACRMLRRKLNSVPQIILLVVTAILNAYVFLFIANIWINLACYLACLILCFFVCRHAFILAQRQALSRPHPPGPEIIRRDLDFVKLYLGLYVMLKLLGTLLPFFFTDDQATLQTVISYVIYGIRMLLAVPVIFKAGRMLYWDFY